MLPREPEYKLFRYDFIARVEYEDHEYICARNAYEADRIFDEKYENGELCNGKYAEGEITWKKVDEICDPDDYS
jgi:hypothetical protein